MSTASIEAPIISQAITTVPVLVLLVKICHGSRLDRISLAAITASLSRDKVSEIFMKLLSTQGSFSVANILSAIGALDNLCEFLNLICESTGEYISRDVGRMLSSLAPQDPIALDPPNKKDLLARTSLAMGLVDQLRDAELYSTWIGLERLGLRLEPRLQQIEKICQESCEDFERATLNAIADASIFMTKYFEPEIQALAFKSLLNFCFTPTAEQFLLPLRCTGFYEELERRIIMREYGSVFVSSCILDSTALIN
ncbi:hypothetical protein R3P38DRAFT_3174852 [Favolaschia claudopus]|uniref:26S proteasome non-ATPase regulatory subunit 5 n=1 Tax=Favolaschia claudopus TaxID=2862362 RepID=A0AAW0DDM9_9AGAR